MANKENQKLAKERRAKERRRRQTMTRIGVWSLVVIVLLLITGLIYCIVADPFHDENETKVPESTAATSGASSEDPTYTVSTNKDEVVADGDIVLLNYVGYIDGVEFEGGNTHGYGATLIIGSHSYIDTFEEQLIGHHIGETVEVVVQFPDPYPNDSTLAGKEATFITIIEGIYHEQKPGETTNESTKDETEEAVTLDDAGEKLGVHFDHIKDFITKAYIIETTPEIIELEMKLNDRKYNFRLSKHTEGRPSDISGVELAEGTEDVTVENTDYGIFHVLHDDEKSKAYVCYNDIDFSLSSEEENVYNVIVSELAALIQGVLH